MSPAKSNRLGLVVSLLLALGTAALYWPVTGHPFVMLDDELYVTGNPHVTTGLGWTNFLWAFQSTEAANWHPLTWLSHMADVELFGPDPGLHHWTSVLFHLANVQILFYLLWRMTGKVWQAAFVAALFGVHPLHVESVAWVAERKDVLSGFFSLLTICAYVRYCEARKFGRYLAVVSMFALGLACKPMVVTLPFVLLLLDFWPLGRLRLAEDTGKFSLRPFLDSLGGPLLEKLPMLALSAAAGASTWLSQSEASSFQAMDLVSPGVRIGNALLAYVTYLGKTVVPGALAMFYPHPALMGIALSPWEVAGAALLLAGITFAAIRLLRPYPFLIVGWLWYLGTLFPVIGLFQVGNQALADRYTYIPLIGIFIAAAWGIPEALGGWRCRRHALRIAAIASILALSAAAWVQAGYWRNGIALFTRAQEVAGKNQVVSILLGESYFEAGRYRDAIACYQEALRVEPNDTKILNDLGVAHARLGQFREAGACFQEALRVDPGNSKARENLSNI